jgi:transcriptional regulator with GAF, ATPase, and Fis domain
MTWEAIVKNTPEVYRDAMSQDPDSVSLAEQWRALLEHPSGEGQPAADPVSSPGTPAYDTRWQRRLLALNKRLNSELRLPRLLELIMDTAIELTEAERGFLLLLEDDGDLSVKVARNIDRRSLEAEELSLSRSIAEQAARSGDPVVTIDAAEDQRFQEALSVSDLRLRSVLATPLLVKGRAVGTIYIDHRLRQGVFGADAVNLVQDFADQAAIAIDNARLLAENRRKADEIEALNHKLQQKVDSQAVELQGVREELRSSKQALQVRYDYKNIIGQTPKIQELFHLLDRVTDTELPVVIQGASGTGKELVARAIHQNGPRAKAPFVGENCAAIPETLLESVLFGHVKGAFTGAERERKGLFEVASGGTLFLDEVGEMSPAMQTKLLRVLQDGELRRVGGTQTIKTDVRVIAASNKVLNQLVEQGSFREDLYYRLNVIQIHIPPLRERREDIPLLVDHFLRKHTADAGAGRRVSAEAMALLMGYPWPGNVRELENEVMRAGALGGPEIEPEDLSPHISGGVPLALSDPDDLDLRTRVEHVERELIARALKRTNGNHTQAARVLGLSRYGLLKKMQRYGTRTGRKKKAS